MFLPHITVVSNQERLATDKVNSGVEVLSDKSHRLYMLMMCKFA